MSTTVTDSKTLNRVISVFCNNCHLETRHRVRAAIDYKGANEDFHWSGTAQIIQCQGCEDFAFRHESWFSEDPDKRLAVYPERTRPSITEGLYLRDDIYDIPEIIQRVYRETVSAVQHDLPTLAGIGIRAVLEAVCQEKKTKKKTLEGKIDELRDEALLTKDGAEILHGIRLLGNIAAHEMKPPSKEQILAALKVIDHLLLGVYVLPKEASILPKRAAKTPKKSVKTTKKTVKAKKS